MITYNDIYEAARKERYSEQLQPITKNFITEVSSYLKEKKEISAKDDDVFSDVVIRTKKQLENAVVLFKELMLRRRKKILNLILIATETGISKQDFENMFQIEKDLFEELMKNIDLADRKMNNLLNGSKKEEIKKDKLICFIEAVEEFVCPDGETMGPFEKGQIANIPKEVAKILIDDKKCEIVEK